MADRLDFSHDINIIDPNKTRLLGFNENPEGARSEFGNLTVEEIITRPMKEVSDLKRDLGGIRFSITDKGLLHIEEATA